MNHHFFNLIIINLPFLGHQNLHWLICNIHKVMYYPLEWCMNGKAPDNFTNCCTFVAHKLTVLLPNVLILFFCMRQSTIRLRMRSAMKAMAPPVTIPSMGTSTRDCRNSAGRKQERDQQDI